MAKQSIGKKEIGDIKKQIIEDVTKDIESKVAKKVTNNIVKKKKKKSTEELKDNFVFEVKNEVKEQIIKEEKKLLRHRTGKIIRRDIVILILIAIIGFMGYLLYKDDYVVVVKERNNQSKITGVSKKEETKDLNWYKKHYSYLIDNMHLKLSSDNMNKYYLYQDNYDVNNINDSIKLSLAYNLLDNTKEKIKKSDLKKAYNQLFNDDYHDASFQIDCKVYKLKKDYYEESGDECLDISNYQLEEEITNIYEQDNNIVIETVMGVSKDNKLYNYHDLSKSITDSYDNIIEYTDDLNTYKYMFNKQKQFISIEKES